MKNQNLEISMANFAKTYKPTASRLLGCRKGTFVINCPKLWSNAYMAVFEPLPETYRNYALKLLETNKIQLDNNKKAFQAIEKSAQECGYQFPKIIEKIELVYTDYNNELFLIRLKTNKLKIALNPFYLTYFLKRFKNIRVSVKSGVDQPLRVFSSNKLVGLIMPIKEEMSKRLDN